MIGASPDCYGLSVLVQYYRSFSRQIERPFALWHDHCRIPDRVQDALWGDASFNRTIQCMELVGTLTTPESAKSQPFPCSLFRR